MVKIDSSNKQTEVNRELDSYLNDRVEQVDEKNNEKVSDFESEDADFDDEKVPFIKKIFGGDKKIVIEEEEEKEYSQTEPEIKEIEEIEEEVEKEIEYSKEDPENKKGKSILSRLFSFLGSDESDNEDEEEFNEEQPNEEPDKEDTEALSSDVKKLIKLQHKWINKLEPSVLDEFKNSDDFSYYKETLDKYGLIKKE